MSTVMFVFITSVRHPIHSFSYEKVWELLKTTLVSVCNQTDQCFRVIVVCNRILHDFKEIASIDGHTEFVVVDYPPISPLNVLTDEEKKRDRGIKYTVGLMQARKYAPDYVMFVDADDFVGSDIVEYSTLHPREHGWFIDKGYVLLGGRCSELNDFNAHCGTCNIFDFALLMNYIDSARIDIAIRDTIFGHVNECFFRYVLGSHKYAPGFFEKEGASLKPFPKRGALWLLDHGENWGGMRGAKRKLMRKLMGPRVRFDAALRQYFNIQTAEDEEDPSGYRSSKTIRLGHFLRHFLLRRND